MCVYTQLSPALISRDVGGGGGGSGIARAVELLCRYPHLLFPSSSSLYVEYIENHTTLATAAAAGADLSSSSLLHGDGLKREN